MSCGQPPTVENADLMDSSFLFEDVIKYKCKSGYYISQGFELMECLANKVWNGTKPVCSRVSCPKLDDVENAVQSGGNLYEDIITYECMGGYVAMGNTKLVCQHDKTWKGSKPYCDRINCTTPTEIAYAKIEGNSTKFTDTIKYICNIGFTTTLGPIQGRICQADATWSGTTPVCSRISCDPPGEPTNAIQTGSETKYQSKILYSCKEGHEESDGEKEITCQADTTWNGLPLICESIECPEPEYVENAHSYGNNDYESIKKYICKSGYILGSGDLSRKCLLSKRWSGSPPVCVKPPITTPKPSSKSEEINPIDLENTICQRLDDVASADRFGSNGYAGINDVVGFVCWDGYFFEHDPSLKSIEIVCKLGGVWDKKLPKCVPKSCNPPIKVSGANIIGPKVHLIGTLVEYRCPLGKHFNDLEYSRIVTCMDNQKWSTDPSDWKCQDITCVTMINGTTKNVKYMETIWIPCPPGQLHIDGRAGVTAYCRLSGWLHPRAPSCAPGRCGPTPEVVNANVVDLDTLHHAKFKCNDGMRFPDGHRIKYMNCTEHEIWQPGSFPPCSPWNCPPPPTIANSTDNKPKAFPMGTKINYECNHHHSFPDKKLSLEIECTGETEWSVTNPGHCKETFCSTAHFSLTLILNKNKTLHKVDSELHIGCKNAYLPDGTTDKKIKCLPTGDWSSDSGDCSNARCKKPLDVPNSEVTGNVTDFGSVWVYTCIKGHKFRNSKAKKWDVKCLTDDSWNDTVPACVEVICQKPVDIGNAGTAYTSVNMGSIATHTCKTGYHFQRKNPKEGQPLLKEINSTCMENEKWDLDSYWIQKGCTGIFFILLRNLKF